MTFEDGEHRRSGAARPIAAPARYAALKQQLATSSKDEDAYTRTKTDLIQEFVDAARTSRGLPLVPVWEE